MKSCKVTQNLALLRHTQNDHISLRIKNKRNIILTQGKVWLSGAEIWSVSNTRVQLRCQVFGKMAKFQYVEETAVGNGEGLLSEVL